MIDHPLREPAWASRLCSLADDGQILLDPVVHERVRDSFALASIGERPIKGYDRALEIFAVVGTEASASSGLVGPVGQSGLERPRLGLALAETG